MVSEEDLKIISEDRRKIDALYLAQSALFVGDGVDKIVPYYENGEMSPVLWFAIYLNGTIIRRVNSKFVESVRYPKNKPLYDFSVNTFERPYLFNSPHCDKYVVGFLAATRVFVYEEATIDGEKWLKLNYEKDFWARANDFESYRKYCAEQNQPTWDVDHPCQTK